MCTCICDFRRVPKVGSLTGRMTISLFDANTVLFSPESTVPTSCTGCCTVCHSCQALAQHEADDRGHSWMYRFKINPVAACTYCQILVTKSEPCKQAGDVSGRHCSGRKHRFTPRLRIPQTRGSQWRLQCISASLVAWEHFPQHGPGA